MTERQEDLQDGAKQEIILNHSGHNLIFIIPSHFQSTQGWDRSFSFVLQKSSLFVFWGGDALLSWKGGMTWGMKRERLSAQPVWWLVSLNCNRASSDFCSVTTVLVSQPAWPCKNRQIQRERTESIIPKVHRGPGVNWVNHSKGWLSCRCSGAVRRCLGGGFPGASSRCAAGLVGHEMERWGELRLVKLEEGKIGPATPQAARMLKNASYNNTITMFTMYALDGKFKAFSCEWARFATESGEFSPQVLTFASPTLLKCRTFALQAVQSDGRALEHLALPLLGVGVGINRAEMGWGPCFMSFNSFMNFCWRSLLRSLY